MGEGEMLSVKRVARFLGVEAQTVRRLIWAGRLPAVHIGKRAVRISRAALGQFMRDNAVKVRTMAEAHTSRKESSDDAA